MKTSHGNRHRPSRRETRQSTAPGLGRKLRLILILGAVAIGGWLAFHFLWYSDSIGVVSPLPLPGAGHDVSSNASPVRQASQNSDAFSRQVNRGNELLAQGKPDQAVEVLTQAVRMNPENEDVHYDLGLALARQGKLEEAIQQYSEALRIFPNYVEAHNNLGNVLMRTGRTDEAIKHFEMVLKIMPDYASAHNNLGTAFQKLGRMGDALPQFQRAVKLNPDYWEAHFNVATTYLQQGRTNEVRGELETVLRLRPDFEPAKSALAALQGQESSAGLGTSIRPP